MQPRSRIFGALLLWGTATLFCQAQGASDADLRREIEELKERLARLEALLETREPAPATTAEAPATASSPAPTAASTEAPDPSAFKASWKDGLRFETPSRDFEFQLGGRLQYDWAFFTANESLGPVLGDLNENTEFRRARVLLAADLYRHVELKAEYDFAGGDSEFKDVYIALNSVPGLGSVRFGHQKEPFSLEELTSSKYITFLERSLPNVFAPSRNSGVLAQRTFAEDRINWAGGVFRNTNDQGLGRLLGGYRFTTRFTGLPWYRDEGRKLLHLGVAYSRQNNPEEVLIYTQRPEAHLYPGAATTGVIASRSQDLLGLEAALVNGPFSLQGEFVNAFVDAPSVGDPRFSSYYVQASFFPTGEHRNYRTSSAAFDRLRPQSNFFDGSGGAGAWELAVRFSHLDFEDAGVAGETLDNFTFGVNWYLNPNTRVMWNYVFANREETENAHIFQTRFHIDF